MEEKLNISMKSDGSIDVLEVKGSLAIVSHDASCGKIRDLDHSNTGFDPKG